MYELVASRFSKRGLVLAAALVCAIARPPVAAAQTTPPPIARLTMEEAVRLAVDRNQDLRAQRLTIDMAKADETTAALRPNINFSFDASGLPVFSPSQLTGSTFKDVVGYDAGLGFTFERGGKRDKRILVARDTTDVTAKNVFDAERNVRFQTEQAFIAVLLAKSSLQLAQDNLASFKNVVDVNRQRVTSGDLSQGDFLMVTLQQLQFETDVSWAPSLGLRFLSFSNLDSPLADPHVGQFKGPILHGMAARAPYFHNGMAATLSDVVDFYDARFAAGFTPEEKADLVSFLESL